MSKYKAGEVLEGSSLPIYSELFADRHDRCFFRHRVRRSNDPVALLTPRLDGTLLVVGFDDFKSGSDYSDRLEDAARAESRISGFESIRGGGHQVRNRYGLYSVMHPMPEKENRTINDAAISFIASNIYPPKNQFERDALSAAFCMEWGEISHGVMVSDWDHIDTQCDEPWWQAVNPFQDSGINELARCAIWWSQLIDDSIIANNREDMF